MIDSVRNTVLAILNKNNYGYITPADFNLYAKQAQLDIFEEYFYSYNYQVNKENARVSGTGYADMKKQNEEVIDSFSEQVFLTQVGGTATTTYLLPTDYYLINKIYYYASLLASGTNTAIVVNELVDGAATFTLDNIKLGDIVVNITNQTRANVLSVINDTNLGLSADIFTAPFGDSYGVYDGTKIREVERVHQNKIFYLNSSSITAPSSNFPAYTLDDNTITVYPVSINGATDVMTQYIRYPKDPKWTYFPIGIGDAEPIFDQNALDYQDFELPDADEPDLILKILQYAGVSIRELDVYTVAQQEEQQEIQEQQ